jgi:hypothetical protein
MGLENRRGSDAKERRRQDSSATVRERAPLFRIKFHPVRGCPSIRAKALSRHKTPEQCFVHRVIARVAEDRSTETLTVNQLSAARLQVVPPTIDTVTNCGHDSSIRIPAFTGTRAPNQGNGLSALVGDQGHPLPDNTPHGQNCSICALGKIHQSEIHVLPDRKIFSRILLACIGRFSRFRKQTA